MKWLHRNLFRRLLISYMVTVLLGLAVMGTVVWFLTKNFIVENQQTEMLRQAKRVNLALQDIGFVYEEDHQYPDEAGTEGETGAAEAEGAETTGLIPQDVESILEFLGQSFNSNIWLFDENGEIIVTSMRDEVYVGNEVRGEIVEQIMQGRDVIRNELQVAGMTRPLMSVTVPWGEEDQVYGGIVLTSSVDGIDAAASNIRETVLWASLLGVLISMTIISYISWSISRPINHIKQAASEIALGNYSQRVEVQDQDEIGELSTTFNRMAAELEKNERERKAHDQKRDHFITNISHELRTPLTAMQGFLEALQDELVQDEPSRQRYYKVMYQESMYLNRLVDDLMDLIKLEKGEVHLEHEWVHMGEIAEKVAFTLQPCAQQKKNKVEVHYSRDLPPIWADPVRVEQIFINLIQNANKFTDKGRITVRLKSFGKCVRMTIADTGVGIPSHDLPKIWDRFFKVKRDRSKKEGGTGLGLAIVKELVDLHGGSIDVESELGKGTTFTLTIPFRKQ